MTPRERAENIILGAVISDGPDGTKTERLIDEVEQAITEAVAEERERANRAISALEDIATFNDKGANAYLANTGSYGYFDEPGSVLTARKALSALSAPPAPEGGE